MNDSFVSYIFLGIYSFIILVIGLLMIVISARFCYNKITTKKTKLSIVRGGHEIIS